MNLVALAAIGLVANRFDIRYPRLREHLGTLFLGKVQVVLVERVLGPVATADHAAAAQPATGALRSLPAKERVRHGDAGLAKIDADIGPVEGVTKALVECGVPQQLVGPAQIGVLNHSQHVLGRIKKTRHDRFPVIQGAPLGVIPDRVFGYQ